MRGRGADLHAFALEGDGIDTEALAGALEQGFRPKLAHIIPNFQNPAGYTLSASKRARLLELAVEHDFTIIEDDPYVSIRFEGEPIPSMFSNDEAGRVVYASSFSKTVCPGIRVGYLVGPQAIIKQIQTIATNTYISPNMVAQSIVNQFARSGRMDGAINTVKTALRARRDAVVNALQRELPEAKFAAPSGGYFMWVELPEAVDVAELEKAAAERDVLFVKGTDFLLEGGQNTLRLAYSGVTPEQIDEGITKLADAVRSLGVAA
jgi:DNA-binding transcriptional MocR family regulator